MGRKLNIQNIQDVLDCYVKTGSTKKTAILCNIKQAQVQYLAKKYGILKNMSESRRIYHYNEDYFSVIDTEHKAYWLGLLYADGSVCYEDGTPRLSIALKEEDKYLLEVFLNDLESNAMVKTYEKKSGKYKGNHYSGIYIRSKKLCDSLESHGCIRRKSTTKTFPTSIPDELIPHFIRGYFDGNGSVFISKEKHWRHGTIVDVLHFRIMSTENMVRVIDKYLRLHGRITVAHPEYNTNMFELAYKRRKKARQFYEYLYGNATIWMERKRIVFEKHFKERCSETIISQPV